MTEPLAGPIPEAARLGGVCRGTHHAKISKANLNTRKIKRRRDAARLLLKASLAFDMEMSGLKKKRSRHYLNRPKRPEWVVVFILLSALGHSNSNTFSLDIRTQGSELELRYSAGLHPLLPRLKRAEKSMSLCKNF